MAKKIIRVAPSLLAADFTNLDKEMKKVISATVTPLLENGKLDKAGIVTNILLIPVYVILTLFCIALSLFTAPGYEGILGIVGWIVCVIIASAPLFCGIGLGLSVSLRKKGKSKQSFLVQFAGIAGSALSILLFVLCYDNLLSSLN